MSAAVWLLLMYSRDTASPPRIAAPCLHLRWAPAGSGAGHSQTFSPPAALLPPPDWGKCYVACRRNIGGKPESRSRVYPPSTWGNCDSVHNFERQCAHARPPARPPAVSKGSYGHTNGRIRPHLRPPPPATMRTPKYPNCTTSAFSNLNKKMKRLRTAAEKMLLYWNALRGSKI